MLEDKDFEFVDDAPVTNEEVEEPITDDDFTLTEVDSTIHEQKFQTKPTTFTKDAFRRFKKNKSSVAATFILGTLIALSIIVPIADRNDIGTNHPNMDLTKSFVLKSFLCFIKPYLTLAFSFSITTTLTVSELLYMHPIHCHLTILHSFKFF